MLARVLRTECLKLKRTLALGMVVVAPGIVVAIQILVIYFDGGQMTRVGRDVWPQIVTNTLVIWTLLLLPLFVTLETSLLAGLEHADKNWKSLLALPCPRWTVYLSKLLVALGLLWMAHAVLAAGTILSVGALKVIRPAVPIDPVIWRPFLVPIVQISGAATLGVAIQHWVSLRWQSYPAALGFGMCAMIGGFAAINSEAWGPWVPWSMPLYALRVQGAMGSRASVAMAQAASSHRPSVLLVAVIGAALVTIAGCWDFSRRDVAT
jgi:hypothetical protein